MRSTGRCCRLPSEKNEPRMDFLFPLLCSVIFLRVCEILKDVRHRQVENISEASTQTGRPIRINHTGAKTSSRRRGRPGKEEGWREGRREGWMERGGKEGGREEGGKEGRRDGWR